MAVGLQVQQAPLLVAGAFALVILGSVAPVVRGADLNRKGAGERREKIGGPATFPASRAVKCHCVGRSRW
jgi:hypothetical protein